MANVTITQLPAAGAITGSELVPIVQNGQTVRTTTGAIAASPSQTQTFLTLNQEPSLPNSRYLQGGTGIGLTDNGALSYLQIVLNGASGSLEAASNGIIVKTGSASVTNRSVAVSGDGLAISNGNGIAGNPTISLTGIALAMAQMSGTGMLAIVGGSTIASRTLLGTADQIDIANGDGTNSPIFSLASNPIIPGTGAITIPIGTTAQRPVGQDGMIRYNSETSSFEVYDSGSWTNLPAGAVTFVGTGTGLTGGPITGSGTISIANTGVIAATYGTSAAVPQIIVNAQGQITSATEVMIDPAAIGAVASVTGTANEIDATGTTNVVLSLPTNLTFTGKTVTGGTFDMVAATLNSIPVATTEGVETLKNKTISGADNTLSNIGNSSLTNSSVTYNGVAVALGASGTITAANPNALTIGTGLSGSSYDGSAPITIAISNTGVSATTYGSASSVPVIAVNAQGQITSATDTSIAINGNQITAGTVGVAYGGTGLASYAAGDLIYASGATTLTKLTVGSNGQVLTSSGTAPQWSNQSSLSVGSATNATNTAITDDTSTNATMYPTWVTANTGNLPQKVTSTKLFFNPSTGVLTATGGIAGGTF